MPGLTILGHRSPQEGLANVLSNHVVIVIWIIVENRVWRFTE